MTFDLFAPGYDDSFTYTEIGKKQRRMVHDFLEAREDTFHSVFEVNCGTGEDALWLARKGKEVLATDISEAMIRTGKQKAMNDRLPHLHWMMLDANKAAEAPINRRYDLVFSNFGGLNCLSPVELERFLVVVRDRIVQPGGRVILVMMSKGSIWESLFFLAKRSFGKVFRRWTHKALNVPVNGNTVATYYYNPRFFRAMKQYFSVETVRTVGFFLPPSYLEAIFAKRPGLLAFLFRMEKRFSRCGLLASFSDHYLIELKPR